MKGRLLGVVGASCVVALALGCSEPVSMEEIQQTPSTESKNESSPVETETASVESAESNDEYQLKKAGVGATGKGQYGVSSEQPMSIITTPVSTYFYAQEKTVFDMQIPQALNLFQASEGRYPNQVGRQRKESGMEILRAGDERNSGSCGIGTEGYCSRKMCAGT